MLSCNSAHTAFYPVSLFPSGQQRVLQKKKNLAVSPVSPTEGPSGNVNSVPSARCYVANSDPTLSIDGTKLAVNPSMHCAVPEAASLLKQSLL